MTLGTGDTAILDDVDVQILSTLARKGGRVEDDQGFATKLVFNGDTILKPKAAPSEHLRILERLDLVEREVRGKRTYSIELTELGRNMAERMEQVFEKHRVSLADTPDEQLLDEVAVRMKTEDHSDCKATISQITTANEQFKESQSTLSSQTEAIRLIIKDVNDGHVTLLQAIQNISGILEVPEESHGSSSV